MINKKLSLLLAAMLIAVLFAFASVAGAEILDGDLAYISTLSVSEMVTGTEPFDGNNEPGNDHCDKNKIVRSFDTVTYRLNMTLASYNTSSADGNQFEQARIHFAFKIPYSSDEAVFNTSSMAWMEPGFRVEETEDGQILYCSILKDESPNYAVPGTQSVFVSLYIKGLKNGTKVVPAFYAWMDGNCVFDEDGELDLSQITCAEHGEKELKKVTPEEVTVSAKLKLNVRLTNFSGDYAARYDFNTGNGADSDYPAMNKGKGVLNGSGVSIAAGIAIVNDTVNKGMRGVELPDGSPISFDIQLDTIYKPEDDTELPVTGTKNGVPYDFSPMVYSYGGYTYDYKNDDGRSVSQRFSMPNNIRRNSSYVLYACCNGGLLQLEQEGNMLHLTFSGYEIDGTYPVAGSPISNTVDFGANIGYIATAELHFFLPHYNQNGGTEGATEDYIAQMFGRGSFVMNVSAGNLRTNSLEAPDVSLKEPDIANQVLKNDDNRTTGVYLTNPGEYTAVCAYASKTGTNQYHPLTPDCFYDGRDWTFADTEIAITAGVWAVKSKGEDLNRMVAFDDFLKIDTDALTFVDRLKGSTAADYKGYIGSYDTAVQTPDGIVDFRQTDMPIKNGQKIKILYAVKKDGSGWASDDEMRQTTQESSNLIWFDRLDNAKASGEVVGLLFQYRGMTKLDVCYPRYQVLVHVKPDAVPDNTYMITHELRIWNARSLMSLGYEPPIPADEDITWYNDKIPLRSATDTGYQEDLDTYLAACCAHFNRRYDRLIYNEDGSTTGATTSFYYGDTVYIAPYSTKIGIGVINSASTDESAVFDMGAEQNVADFELSPVVNLPSVANTAIENAMCDTITVTQTLPAGLSYIPGSSVYGGAYVPAAKYGRQGTVVADAQGFMVPLKDDGKATFDFKVGQTTFPVTVTLNVSRNASGETTLEYVFEGVPLSAATDGKNALSEKIRFSAEIEPNTVATWTLKETVSIHGKNEKTKLAPANSNIADASILVYQNTAEGIGVKADHLYNEQDAVLGWTINYTNASNMARSDALLFVRMPEDRYTGTYAFTEWTLDLSALGSAGSDLELWYTTGDVSDKNAADYTRDQLSAQGSGFAKLELTTQGDKLVVSSIPEAAKHTTAWILTGSIGAQKTFEIHHSIKPSGNIPSDSYRTTAYFRASGNAPHSYATVYVVGRDLSGLVWYDKNYNGIRETGESLVSGVTVELYNGSEKVTRDVTGAALPSVVTDANGAYSFAKLPEGEYTVRFTNLPVEYTGVTRHLVAGADASVNNDAQTVGGVTQTSPAAGLSSAEEIGRNYTQHITHLDMGLIKTGEIGIVKTVTGDIPDAEADREFNFVMTLTLDGAPYTQSILMENTQVTPTAEGKVTVTLKQDEDVSFSGIPVGTAYAVTETAAAHYTAAFTNAAGVISDTKASVACVNHYQPDAAAYKPSVTKVLNGQTPPAAAVFTFTIANVSGRADGFAMPANTQTTITGTGTAQFGDVTFSKAGTYVFTISEEATAAQGYTDDANGVWTLTVVVLDRNGALIATPAYARGEATSETAVFTNAYVPASTEYSIAVTKRIEGVVYGEEAYTFELTERNSDSDQLRMPADTQATVTGAGTAAFDPISFFAAGEYRFSLREIPGNADNCVYDSAEISVTITVTDAGGALAVTNVAYAKNGVACEPEFVNAYRTGHLSITKTVKENDADLNRAWHFTITIKDDSGNVFGSPLRFDGSAVGTVTSGGTVSLTHGQTITIRNIPEGMNYEITEIEADIQRYTTVATGQTGVIASGTTAAAAFVNTFKPYPTEHSITVEKRIEGSPAEEETYVFQMEEDTARDGCVMPESTEATVTGSGAVVFEPIIFTEVGEYRFELQEVAGNTENCTYDDSRITVVITVSNVNGQLTVTKTVYEKNGEECEPAFVNAYQAGSLTIVKTVEGNDGETARQWNFTVLFLTADGEEYKTTLRYDGSVSGTVTTGGTIALRHGERVTIHSIPEGITYTVTEMEANVDGYTTVSAGAAGIIVNGENSRAEFTNTRIKAEIPQTGDSTHVLLLCLMFAISTVVFPLLYKKESGNR